MKNIMDLLTKIYQYKYSNDMINQYFMEMFIGIQDMILYSLPMPDGWAVEEIYSFVEPLNLSH